MDESECQESKSAFTIEVVETTFLKHLGDSGLLEGDGQLLLDIDEDFFGTESGVTVLTKSGIQWKTISQIDRVLMSTICPKTTADEKAADQLMTEVVKLVFKMCKVRSGCDEKKAVRLAAVLVNKRRKEQKLKYFCRSEKITNALVKFIAKELLKMNKEQLKTLIDVGFCARTTPKAYNGNAEEGYFDNQLFQICHGVNTPNETIVITHSPDDEEVNTRMNLLNSIVQHDDFPIPRMVTICRSMRDGYTPKNYFHKIEAGVIDIVKRKLSEHKFNLTYDIDLLGGAHGWPGRHKKWTDKL